MRRSTGMRSLFNCSTNPLLSIDSTVDSCNRSQRREIVQASYKAGKAPDTSAACMESNSAGERKHLCTLVSATLDTGLRLHQHVTTKAAEALHTPNSAAHTSRVVATSPVHHSFCQADILIQKSTLKHVVGMKSQRSNIHAHPVWVS